MVFFALNRNISILLVDISLNIRNKLKKRYIWSVITSNKIIALLLFSFIFLELKKNTQIDRFKCSFLVNFIYFFQRIYTSSVNVKFKLSHFLIPNEECSLWIMSFCLEMKEILNEGNLNKIGKMHCYNFFIQFQTSMICKLYSLFNVQKREHLHPRFWTKKKKPQLIKKLCCRTFKV